MAAVTEAGKFPDETWRDAALRYKSTLAMMTNCYNDLERQHTQLCAAVRTCTRMLEGNLPQEVDNG